jgi:hypothetical protein
MNWRRLNHALHRDTGFLCVGLTLIYALSGIAVNHVHDWNPNYRIERVKLQIDPLPRGLVSSAQVQQILRQTGESKISKKYFQPDADNLWLYADTRMLRVNLSSGEVQAEKPVRRAFWYRLNFLHLNHAKQAWTWIADLYAAGLCLLAITGLLLLPKRSDLKRRALMLSAAGVIIPLIFLLIFF